ncbi:MAG: rRNA maturation RNase YbeY [Dehalococcoidia bacterium]|nr:rRNA maturation RNase YbeY [Dehalococcoidia bacterium]
MLKVKPHLKVIIGFQARHPYKPDEGLLKKAAQSAVKAAGVTSSVEMGISVTGDSAIRRLNSKYRGLDEVTDVLSFGLRDGDKFPASPDGILRIGDVVLAYPTCKKQALEHGHTADEEAALLTIHGTLHLLGYDHEASTAEAVRMKKAERVALKSIGLPNLSRI